MEENKDYQVYRFDYLTEGHQLKLDDNVYCEDMDISSLITQGCGCTGGMVSGQHRRRAESPCNRAGGGKAQWEQQAAVTQKLNRSLEYL